MTTLGPWLFATFSSALAPAQAPTQSPLRIMVPDVVIAKGAAAALPVTPGALATMLAQGALQARAGQVLTEQDAQAVLNEAARAQLTGCTEMRCALDLSKLAGADLLLRAEVGMLGPRVLVNASLVHVAEARVLSVATRSMAPEQLGTGGLGAMAMGMFGQAGGAGDAPPAPPPAVPPGPPQRVVVTCRQWANEAGDPAARATAMGRSAEVVGSVGGYKAISAEELATVVKSEAEQQALGNGDASLLQRVADQLKAPYLVSLDVGRAGDAFVVGAALLDVQKADAVNRASIVFKEGKQLLEAITVVTKRLFGVSAQLPPPDADPNRLEARLQALAQDVLGKYGALPQGGAAGLVILPFGETAPEPKQRKLGNTLAQFMQSAMQTQPGITVAPAEKVAALGKSHDLSNPLGLDAGALTEIGMFLGAQAVLVGNVGDFGTDYVLQAKLVKVAGAQALWSGNVVFPKAKPGSLLPKKVRISRSRADALTRAVVPGLAQFTGGPLGIVKGALFDVILVGGLALLVPAAASIVFGSLLFIANFPRADGTRIPLLTVTYKDPGGAVGDDPDCSFQEHPTDANVCGMPRNVGMAVAGVGGALVAAGLASAALAYLVSFVDAGIFGVREEEVSFEAAE
ncbi:MAG: hypothetical protein HY904_05920 [Deltaproteobacteria bacterium]|nr:hypothetical protein [Deltaproteobacteria bacterium]